MSEQNRPIPDNNEPDILSEHAEGYPDKPLDPAWTTPGQAEGERNQLDDTLPGRTALDREESSSGGLWERVKSFIGLGKK